MALQDRYELTQAVIVYTYTQTLTTPRGVSWSYTNHVCTLNEFSTAQIKISRIRQLMRGDGYA